MVVEAFLCALVGKVLTKIASLIEDRVGMLWGIHKELSKLQSLLLTIRAVLEDAEERQIKDLALRLWLAKLKDAAYDAEDILDELTYELLRPGLAKVWVFFRSTYCSLLFRIRMAPQIKEIVERIDEIAEEMSKFHLRTNGSEIGESVRLRTHSFVVESHVIGREKDKENIVELLIGQNGSKSLTVLPIVGIGGVGKTTLAQMVFNDQRAAQRFDNRIWVCVSDDFDVMKIVKAINESVTNDECRTSNMDLLQRRLRENLTAKRFLLVLDDVWNENLEKWDGLKDLLTVGAEGSVVIVTTRSEVVSLIVGTVEAYKLALLSEEDCWDLFRRRAFFGRAEEPPNLVTMGKEIVKKCRGLPLAAKALGSLMRLKSEEWEWKSVMQGEVWELEDEEIMPSLRLSYSHLPSHMKQCFAYCAIFPKDYEMDKDILIQLWMANGLIPTEEKMELEEKGHKIFTELGWRSFFQDIKEVKRQYDSDTKTTCKMHDLLHDLALSIMANECCILDNPKTISNRDRKIRHLSISYFADLSNINTLCTSKTLRTLLPLVHGMLVCDRSLNTLSKNKYLRVLDLRYSSKSDVHISLSYFKYLRYLDLSYSDIDTLPEKICSLFYLQTLKLIHCESLLKLPRGMRNLSKLRHLYLDNCYRLRCMPRGMGRLSHLQTLTRYVVGEESRRGSIGELKNLNLQGTLELCNLKNVSSKEDAREVNLVSKHNLRVLKLDWGMSTDQLMEENLEDVLEALQPPDSLKRFTIQNYRGTAFPSWLVQDPVPLKNLVEIILTGCSRCEDLPPLGQLPLLEVLDVEYMDSLRYIGGTRFYGSAGTDQNSTTFPSLKIFKLHTLDNLEKWLAIEERLSFPQLVSLKICRCPNLRTIPLLPTIQSLEIESCSVLFPSKGFFRNMTTLEKLKMHECDKMTLLLEQEDVETKASIQELMIRGCQKPMFSSLGLWKKINSLQYLSLEWCSGLKFLPVGVFQGLGSLKCLQICYCSNLIGSSLSELDGGLQLQYLTSLEKLAITGCQKLVSFPQDSLKHLTTLKAVELGDFQKMRILPEFPELLLKVIIAKCPYICSLPSSLGCCTALVCLRIQGLRNLSSLPEWMHGLHALEDLTITDCPKLISLPKSLQQRLPKLKCLWIENCPELERLCMRGGEYGELVLHIPVRSVVAGVEPNGSSNIGQQSRSFMIATCCSTALLKAEKDLSSDLDLHDTCNSEDTYPP